MIIRLLLLLALVSGCRTVQKSLSETAVNTDKTEQSSSKFNREIITEYVVDTLWRTRLDTLYKTVAVPDYHVIEKPYIIRQTIREQGEQQVVKQEQIQVREKEKQKEASFPVTLQWAAIIFAAAAFITAVVFAIRQFK